MRKERRDGRRGGCQVSQERNNECDGGEVEYEDILFTASLVQHNVCWREEERLKERVYLRRSIRNKPEG